MYCQNTVTGPRARGRERRGVFFFIAGGLYSVTALRENDQERVTVYKVYFLIAGMVLTFRINITEVVEVAREDVVKERGLGRR